MNIKQKALIEKAIKIRYNGLIDSLKSTRSVVESDNETIGFHLYRPSTDIADLSSPQMKRDYQLIVKTIADLEKKIEDENVRRKAVREDALKQRISIVNSLRHERDDKIIKVAFQGEDKDVLSELKRLPTAKQVVEKLGTLKLTGELRDATGIGDDYPSSMSYD